MWPFGSPGRLDSRALGRLGERRAAWFYRLRGYRIVARNVRTARGELDLVVRRGHVLAFVEVKTRQSLAAGEGWASVTPAKQARLYELAAAFLARNPIRGVTCRFDVISIFRDGRRLHLTHFAGAFTPLSDERHPWRLANQRR